MRHYSYDFKVKLVQEYQRGEGSAKDLKRKYGIASSSLISRWIEQVQNGGFNALHPGEWIRYPTDFKVEVVDYCLNNDMSLNATALYFGVDNPTVSKWVKAYQKQGIAGFCPTPKRRTTSMKRQSRPTTKSGRQQQEIQQLKDELYSVKMERDVLKKLIAVTHKRPPMQQKHQ